MKRSGMIMGLVVSVFLLGCDGAVAEHAADRADDGESQGFGSDAFRERHAARAAMLEDRGHPVFDEHPALRVHRALADGERPTGVGKKQAAVAQRMAEEAGVSPEGAGPPAGAGPRGR